MLSGANSTSLVQAQLNHRLFGACDENGRQHGRSPGSTNSSTRSGARSTHDATRSSSGTRPADTSGG
ncbi:CPCC family cysteine-rich protein [Kitasatospora sp. KL5]|uniref:CPCC family cysteine-rich protein n=1 Tax=Kitasatospora sp. KL5 TaxID=3425125 RepID=UPI003D6FA6F7